jgi:hypothetical protein
VLTYDFEGKAYWNGERIPRVTEIIRLIAPRNWDVDDYFLHKGTLVHRIIQWKIEGSLDESSVDPLLKNYLGAYQQFTDDVFLFMTKKTEVSFYSPKYKFCGRADLLAMYGHYLSVFDLKSGSPHEGDRYQTAAYLFGLKDAGFPCWRAFDLYLKKNGKYSLVEQKNPTSLFNTFKLGLKKWREENGSIA